MKPQMKWNEYTFTAGNNGYITGSGPNIIDDRPLDPRNQKVCALSDDIGLHTSEPVKYNGSRTAIHWKTGFNWNLLTILFYTVIESSVDDWRSYG